MSLEDLKDKVKCISLSHKYVESFYVGEDALIHLPIKVSYPSVFLEIPYSIPYTADRRFKEVNFALLVLDKGKQDDVEGDHKKISDCEQIGDAILAMLQGSLNNDVSFNNINGLSLREFSDNNLSGIRFEITARMKRDYCQSVDLEDVFGDCSDCNS
jgi:hypothetical protein